MIMSWLYRRRIYSHLFSSVGGSMPIGNTCFQVIFRDLWTFAGFLLSNSCLCVWVLYPICFYLVVHKECFHQWYWYGLQVWNFWKHISDKRAFTCGVSVWGCSASKSVRRKASLQNSFRMNWLLVSENSLHWKISTNSAVQFLIALVYSDLT